MEIDYEKLWNKLKSKMDVKAMNEFAKEIGFKGDETLDTIFSGVEVAMKDMEEDELKESNGDERYLCEICGSEEDVVGRSGGAVTFLCKVCEKIINRWNYANAKFKHDWLGITDDDIAEMRKIAEMNDAIKDDKTDNSMPILLDDDTEE